MAITEYYETKDAEGNVVKHLEKSFEGLVVETGEHNHYDDSDFFAIIYNPFDGSFFERTYASTRYWSYGNGASVDAPESLREQYREWLKEMDRIKRENYLKSFGIPMDQAKALLRYMDSGSLRFNACVKLLKTQKFRSSFRESLRGQLEKWIGTVQTGEIQYNTPFSEKQWEVLLRNERPVYRQRWAM